MTPEEKINHHQSEQEPLWEAATAKRKFAVSFRTTNGESVEIIRDYDIARALLHVINRAESIVSIAERR